MFRRGFVASLALMMLGGCSGMLRDGSLVQVRREFGDGNYKQCIARADSARRYFDEDAPANEDAELLFYKAQCLDLDGRKAEAEVFYERVVSKYPKSDWGLQAAARLKENRAKDNRS
jgi:hypothetical protein